MGNVIVVIAVLASALYFGRFLYGKVKSFRAASKGELPACACCGGCKGGKDCASKKMAERLISISAGKGTGKKAFAAVSVSALALTLIAPAAFAADTTEAYGPGEISFEAHQSFMGFRNGRMGLGLTTEGLLGVGIAKYLSAQLNFAFGSNGYLSETSTEVSVTLLSTLLDTEKFDLDVWLSASEGSLTPGLELNFDPIDRFGVYLRLEFPIGGGDRSAADILKGKDPYEIDWGISLTPGVYFNVAEGHQLLLEAAFDLGWCKAEDRSGNLDLWSLALGYNFMVTDKVEIVTEVKTFRPDGGDQEFGIHFGVIASLPD